MYIITWMNICLLTLSSCDFPSFKICWFGTNAPLSLGLLVILFDTRPSIAKICLGMGPMGHSRGSAKLWDSDKWWRPLGPKRGVGVRAPMAPAKFIQSGLHTNWVCRPDCYSCWSLVEFSSRSLALLYRTLEINGKLANNDPATLGITWHLAKTSA